MTSEYFQECYKNKSRKEMCGELELVERVDKNTIITHLKNKGKFIFSPRDLLIVQNRHCINEDEVLITRANINTYKGMSQNHNNSIRADAKVYGIFLKKLNHYQTHFQAYILIDLRGNIPNFCINMMIDKNIEVFEVDVSYIQSH